MISSSRLAFGIILFSIVGSFFLEKRVVAALVELDALYSICLELVDPVTLLPKMNCSDVSNACNSSVWASLVLCNNTLDTIMWMYLLCLGLGLEFGFGLGFGLRFSLGLVFRVVFIVKFGFGLGLGTVRVWVGLRIVWASGSVSCYRRFLSF